MLWFLNNPVDESGSYTISLITTATVAADGDIFETHFLVTKMGFGDVSKKNVRYYVTPNGDCGINLPAYTDGARAVSVSWLGGKIGSSILTLMYNPESGTLHGAYNREPAVLLIKEIPMGQTLLQPFLKLMGDASVTVLGNPRRGL